MENGMGMLTGAPGAPSGDDYGPSLGRGMGVGSTNDEPTSNGSMAKGDASIQGMDHMQMGNVRDLAPNANSVPGFPQDAYMEGPAMAMDEMVDKPENYGLPPGWSGFMQGMMTYVRVLPPDRYDEIMLRIHNGKKQQIPNMPGMEMQDGKHSGE